MFANEMLAREKKNQICRIENIELVKVKHIHTRHHTRFSRLNGDNSARVCECVCEELSSLLSLDTHFFAYFYLARAFTYLFAQEQKRKNRSTEAKTNRNTHTNAKT